MATYPNLPDQRIVVNGVDICETYEIALLDGYELAPPEPKTYTVDIPGGNGVIDLTEALTGDVAYENRTQSFEFACIYPDDFEKIKTKLSNFLHGRAFDYTLSFDPGYIYHGRFKVTAYTHTGYANGVVGDIKVEIDANPYKKKESKVYKLNAIGGSWYKFESGRRPVHPTIECAAVCYVTWDGKTQTVPAGTYKLNDVLFKAGDNDIYINSYPLAYVYWNMLVDKQYTWADLAKKNWDDIQKINYDISDAAKEWKDLSVTRWSELKSKQWYQLNYGNEESLPASPVYLKYDWEDL